MDEERQVRPGFLPPRAPRVDAPRFQPPARAPEPDRPAFASQRMESGPPSPLALSGTALGVIALLLLVLSAGFAAPLTALMSIVGGMLGLWARQQIVQRGVGRAGQARAAIWVGVIGLGLAVVAFVAIEATGFTQEELQRWLEDELEQQRMRRRDDAGG